MPTRLAAVGGAWRGPAAPAGTATLPTPRPRPVHAPPSPTPTPVPAPWRDRPAPATVNSILNITAPRLGQLEKGQEEAVKAALARVLQSEGEEGRWKAEDWGWGPSAGPPVGARGRRAELAPTPPPRPPLTAPTPPSHCPHALFPCPHALFPPPLHPHPLTPWRAGSVDVRRVKQAGTSFPLPGASAAAPADRMQLAVDLAAPQNRLSSLLARMQQASDDSELAGALRGAGWYDVSDARFAAYELRAVRAVGC